MPFSSTGSVVSTDLDNMLRGLNRDNSDTSHTGDTTETTLKSYSIPANTIGATGGIYVRASGTASGAGGTKTVHIYFGSASNVTLSVASGSQDWAVEMWVFNTSTSAQRVGTWAYYTASGGGAPTISTAPYLSRTEDTTANTTVKITGTLASSGDTITAKTWDVFVVQIT